MGGPVALFCGGAQKGGTTSLRAHLCEHPALSPPRGTGTHFFDDESRAWDAPDIAALEAWYPPDDGARLRFDITPINGFWPPALARVRDYNPAARLIFLFRDPIERAFSHWCMEFARGNETLPFAAAIRTERARLDRLPPLDWERRIISYCERGFYAGQVARALALFPRQQLLFLRSEDLRDRHAATLARIAGFLRIPPFPATGPKREHRRAAAAAGFALAPADRAWLADRMRPDLAQFAALTGLDVSAWPTMA